MEAHVDVGGYRLKMQVVGTGEPTVVFETGSCWSGIAGWRAVLPEVARFTRAFTYDRAGLGGSDKAPTPRTWQDMVSDLAVLLDKASIPGPYVLVGGSSGEILVRLFADRYPGKVAGLVLVDATNIHTRDAYLQLLPPESRTDSTMLRDFRRWFTIQTGGEPGVHVEDIECVDWRLSRPAALALPSLGALPLAVLTAGIPAVDLNEPALPRGLGAAMHEVHLAGQQELAALSTDSRHVVLQDSRHMIAYDRPGIVADAVQKIVTKLR